MRTVFFDVNLEGADFTGAVLDNAAFINCPSLHRARGLASVVHRKPSYLDLAIARRSIQDLPGEFLTGAGCSLEEIAALRALYREPGA
jgi:uncharacterized protein YjbI with pentapeptide repeats